MTPEGFDAACLALTATTKDQPFGPGEHVYKIGGKMFAVLGESGSCSFKVSDIAYEVLTGEGRAKPAPYLARAKWVRLDQVGDWPDAELRDQLVQAHALIAAKLTKKARAELGLA